MKLFSKTIFFTLFKRQFFPVFGRLISLGFVSFSFFAPPPSFSLFLIVIACLQVSQFYFYSLLFTRDVCENENEIEKKGEKKKTKLKERRRDGEKKRAFDSKYRSVPASVMHVGHSRIALQRVSKALPLSGDSCGLSNTLQ